MSPSPYEGLKKIENFLHDTWCLLSGDIFYPFNAFSHKEIFNNNLKLLTMHYNEQDLIATIFLSKIKWNLYQKGPFIYMY